MKRFNLIPKEGRKGLSVAISGLTSKRGKLNRVFLLVIILVVIIALPNIISKQQEGAVAKAREQIEAMKGEINRLQAKRLQSAKDYDLLMKKKLATDERLQYLKESRTGKPDELSQALVSLPTFIPDEIWINKLMIDRGGVIINGSTLNNQAVSQFMDNLNMSKDFKGSSFNFTQKNEIGGTTLYNFEIISNLIK